ncbi:hypothetical protein AcW1_007671 [Taiwanofungus camphoratus]|nr:hypothetical protein AcW1_007671 [Antrodia cinnamomea]
MGGNAFRQTLPDTSFPRISPSVYQALKARLLPLIQSLYGLAVVPAEAPEKIDHGDIDFVVAYPRPGLTHETVKATLKATYSLPQEGNRISNFAVSTSAFELQLDQKQAGMGMMPHQEEWKNFYQIDVYVCADEEEWQRVVFLHSYGDLGMILGVLARSAGLSLSTHGLKLARPLPTNPPLTFHLSSSLPKILAFFELSIERWTQGFCTQREIFDWISDCNLFNAHAIADTEVSHPTRKKTLEDRPMYRNFLTYARERSMAPTTFPSTMSTETLSKFASGTNMTQEDALRFFGKEVEHDTLRHASRVKQHIREVFTGKLVEQWTNTCGLPVRWIMDTARGRIEKECHQDSGGIAQDGERAQIRWFTLAPWEVALFKMSYDEVRTLVLQVRDEMEATGKFDLNWKHEHARKAEKKRQEEQRSSAISGRAIA